MYRIGIDLGGTNIKAGVVDENNSIVTSYHCKTLAHRPWQEVVNDMAMAAQYACKAINISISDCQSVGIGSPGTVSASDGVVIYSNNFPGWKNIPVGETISELVGLPVYISNDANCAALGEVVAGAAKDYHNAVLITLGTGVGGGIIINDKVFEGGTAGGAELGHTTLVHGGELCSCGRLGCLEAYCSANALIRQTKLAAQANPSSRINSLCNGNLDTVNGKTPFDAALEGDKAAQQVIEQYLEWLSDGITDIVNVFRPEIVLISGGVCAQGAVITDPLNRLVRQKAFAGELVYIPEVRRATLGNDAGILGAASLGG